MRKLLLSASLGSAMLLGACTSAQIQATQATIEADIQAGTAALCGIIPTVNTIYNIVSAFVPGGQVTGIVGTGIQLVEQKICSAAPPPASARYRALPRMNAAAPVQIGIVNGIAVEGWRT